MQAADLVSFAEQQTLQHSTACKGIIEMQLINPAHQGQTSS